MWPRLQPIWIELAKRMLSLEEIVKGPRVQGQIIAGCEPSHWSQLGAWSAKQWSDFLTAKSCKHQTNPSCMDIALLHRMDDPEITLWQNCRGSLHNCHQFFTKGSLIANLQHLWFHYLSRWKKWICAVVPLRCIRNSFSWVLASWRRKACCRWAQNNSCVWCWALFQIVNECIYMYTDINVNEPFEPFFLQLNWCLQEKALNWLYCSPQERQNKWTTMVRLWTTALAKQLQPHAAHVVLLDHPRSWEQNTTYKLLRST